MKRLPDIYNPDGSLNEEAVLERSQLIKQAMYKERTMTPGVERLKRERTARMYGWLFRVVLVGLAIWAILEFKAK